MQKTSITLSQFIETRENPTKMLELIDEALDQMTFSIQPTVILSLQLRALMRRNDCRRATFSNLVNQDLGSVAAIRNHVVAGQTFEQIRGLRNVMNLPSGQVQAQRITQTIDDDMQLRTETASATTQGLRLLSAAFFVRLLHRGERAQSCYRSSRFPYPHPRQ